MPVAACCYPDTTCMNLELGACFVTGGIPHPGKLCSEGLCGAPQAQCRSAREDEYPPGGVVWTADHVERTVVGLAYIDGECRFVVMRPVRAMRVQLAQGEDPYQYTEAFAVVNPDNSVEWVMESDQHGDSEWYPGRLFMAMEDDPTGLVSRGDIGILQSFGNPITSEHAYFRQELICTGIS